MNLKVFQCGGREQHKVKRVFFLYFLLLNHLEPQLSETKLLLPIMPIDHFTVVCLVTWPLNGSEAEGDLVLIQTSLLLLCKSCC